VRGFFVAFEGVDRSGKTTQLKALAERLRKKHEVVETREPGGTPVAEAVRAVTGLPAGIKWPNDVQVEERKFCGILTEMEAEIDRIAFIVCGMGLNVNLPRESLPEEFRSSATSWMAELGAPVSRAALVQAVLARLETVYGELIAGRFDAVLDRWRALSITLGQPVRVLSVTGEATVEGVAEDVDEEGALLVRESATGKLCRVMAGEVSLRPATAPRLRRCSRPRPRAAAGLAPCRSPPVAPSSRPRSRRPESRTCRRGRTAGTLWPT